MQAQIDAQQTILNALANNLSVVSIIPTAEGYIILFSDNSAITIKHGEKGEQGSQGEQGEKGDTGDSFFQSVTWDEENIHFTLADGSVITIPLSNQESNEEPYNGAIKTTVRDVSYYEFSIDVKVPESVKDNNNVILWGITDLFIYNKKKNIYNYSDADWCRYSSAYNQINFDESTSITINTENRYCKNPDGSTNYELPFYNELVPGQPTVYIFAESDGVVSNGINAPLLGGLQAKGMVVTQQPEEMGDHITSVEMTPLSNNDVSIRIEVDEEVEKVCVAVYDETCYAETMTYLDNNPNYRQWFTTSLTALFEAPVMYYHPQHSNGVIELKLSDIFIKVDANSKWIIDIVAADGAEGEWIGHRQHYETYEFYISDLISDLVSESNTIEYTSTDGEIVEPSAKDVFGANIISNTYKNGKGVIVFDGDVTSIGEFAFEDQQNLKSITIPDSVTEIGNGAFFYCESLASVIIPDSITSIGDGAFSDCYSLTSITIPDSVTSIGSYAFSCCPILTSITIPNSVTSIGDAPFSCCEGLREIKGKFASSDNRCLIINGTIKAFAPAGLTEYTIPDGIIEIGKEAFFWCLDLEYVTLPKGLKSIGDEAFGYSDLEYIRLPNGLKSIGKAAFQFTGLTTITIPDSVSFIGDMAFRFCERLTSVYCKPTTPPEMGESVFEYTPSSLKIYAPSSSVDTYKSAIYWSEYASYIVGYDFE